MPNKFIKTYFQETKDYPDVFAGEILPDGTMYEYISTTFLNGFINYVEIQKAFLLARYARWNDQDTDLGTREISIRDGGKWTKFTGTKEENFQKLIAPGATFHSKLNDLSDDVVILAKTKNTNEWVYFWFDCDCSDSCIGRFSTEDADEVVIEAFSESCLSFSDNGEKSREIPLHYFKGWIGG